MTRTKIKFSNGDTWGKKPQMLIQNISLFCENAEGYFESELWSEAWESPL